MPAISKSTSSLKKAGLIALAALAATTALSGCAGKGRPQTRLVYEERPVESLYNMGMTRLDQKSWNEAIDYFEEVERQHPYSEWSRRSIVMEIYANYQANNYAESTAAAERFIKLYPGSTLTPYAYYMRAINYFEQIVDVGRDQAYTETAQSYLREIVQRYPGTEYARDAQVKLDMVYDQLAGKEMEIGRYYLSDNQPLAALGRFKTVITKYQTTSHAPEALYRLVEANLMMGITDEANRNAAVLGYNYPGDRWYAAAYKLMKERGQAMDVKPLPIAERTTDKPAKKEQKEKKSWLSRINPM
ncbi:outer membrane protein assembly factor BamD [Asticcacaulis sp. BYS171W]|uniref:Outer membrane protein assembly factor BamD n=1 Tax=Asticcacaulis aquaticus TaxID=2984212 RepID=A0ABT5HXA1_9CAUL|nr:outer membrane protein assembly factor BamD [Asticcacaulis aquaticus]